MSEARIFYQEDCNLSLLEGKTIAIIGYGSQGHAHALNLKESGCNVIIGLYEGSKSWKRAEEQGFKVYVAAEAAKQIAKSGKKILFVATKKQAKEVVAEKASSVNMPYVNERWPGGMLTNFATIRKAVKKMASIDKMTSDGTFSNLSKRELLQITRQRAKLEKNLGSIAHLTRLPSALFVVDVMKENIAVHEANRLGIPVFGIVDTNSNPKNIDFVIPANDDATKSVETILDAICAAIAEGLEERKVEKADAEAAEAQAEAEASENGEAKPRRRRTRARVESAETPVETAAPSEEAASAE